MSLARFNALPRADAERALVACCAAPRWVAEVAAARPYATGPELVAAADLLRIDDLEAAIAAHPRIGEPASTQSAREQAGVAGSSLAALAEANRAYEARFGHMFLICAPGLSGEQMLAALRSRLANDPHVEQAAALEELRKITALRIRALLEHG